MRLKTMLIFEEAIKVIKNLMRKVNQAIRNYNKKFLIAF